MIPYCEVYSKTSIPSLYYLENIIMNAYSIKWVYRLSVFKIDQNKYTKAYFCRINEGCSLNTFTSRSCGKNVYEILASYKWPIEWVLQSLDSIISKQGNDVWSETSK